MAVMSYYEGMSKTFEADTYVYSVYVYDTEIKMSKIPAMYLRDYDAQEDLYRLVAPYFVSELVSTTVLTKKENMGRQLQLKYGTVFYTADKSEAEKYARAERDKLAASKRGQIIKLKLELEALSNLKCKFE